MALSVEQLERLFDHVSELAPFFDFLKEEDYCFSGIVEHLGLQPSEEHLVTIAPRLSFFYAEELNDRPSSLSVLIQLFLMSFAVPRSTYEANLPADMRDLLARFELVEQDRETLRGAVTLSHFDSAYLLSDYSFRNNGGGDTSTVSGAAWDSLVMPVYASSVELASHLARRPGLGRFLDLGSGSGVLSICNRHRYATVAGIDVNPRCVLISKINARLNGAEIDYRVANCLSFEPASPFDHVAFNAPTDLATRFVDERLDAVLAPGGLLQIWLILQIPRRLGTIERFLRDRIRDLDERFRVTVRLLPSSPCNLPADFIARGATPPLYANPFGSQEALEVILKEGDLLEMSVAILDVELARGVPGGVFVSPEIG